MADSEIYLKMVAFWAPILGTTMPPNKQCRILCSYFGTQKRDISGRFRKCLQLRLQDNIHFNTHYERLWWML